MLRVLKKGFSDKYKIEEAKKRALKMYEEMINQKNIVQNREFEESLKNQNKPKSENHDESTNSIRSSTKPKNSIYEKKVQEILANYKMINKTEEKFKFTSDNNYSKIENGILMYKLKKNRLSSNNFSNLSEDSFLNIYENKVNENFEKIKKRLIFLLKVMFIFQTLKLIFHIYHQRLNLSKMKYGLIAGFYTIVVIIYGVNKSFTNRVVSKILIDMQSGRKLKIFMQNSKGGKYGFIEMSVGNMYSITSKRKNIHEIFYYNSKNKVDQLFIPKNGLYDPLLLMNLCHPQVQSVKFLE